MFRILQAIWHDDAAPYVCYINAISVSESHLYENHFHYENTPIQIHC